MGLTDQYSGVVLNQNSVRTGVFTLPHPGWVYQTFTLPGDYIRGTTLLEQRIPDLSGFQVLVNIPTGQALTASFDYTLQYYTGDLDTWATLSRGTMTGATTDGLTWFDILLPQSVPVPQTRLSIPYRIGISTNNITSVAYVDPTPLPETSIGLGQAYQNDGVTPLLGSGTAALNFRVLGLTADSGLNRLGDEYRSTVVFTSPGNTSTVDGNQPVAGSGSGTYWKSHPLPSKFSVCNLYWDMRPAQVTPQIGNINTIGNPSFEYDTVGNAPSWWSSFASGGTLVDQSIYSSAVDPTDPHYTTWTYDRFQALHMKYTFSATSQQRGIISDYYAVAATTGGDPTPLSLSIAYNISTATNSSLYFSVLFYDASQVLLSTQSFDPGIGSGTFQGSTTLPANAVYIRYLVSALSTGAGSFEGFVDGIQATFTDASIPYFDGDDADCEWTGQRGRSPSAQLVVNTPDDSAVVMDGVVINPLTPSLTFNVYYSMDDAYTSDHMTESDWEQKLWTRVPQVFTCNQRQQYVFPRPVRAKYVQIEFTNPQAQVYHPGPFNKPVRYKKFPTWVASYFLAQLAVPSFIASAADVTLDALTFAYSYYLDDLRQQPVAPVVPPTSALSQLSNYFSPGRATAGVDPTTLNLINRNMDIYQTPVERNIDISTTLGSFVNGLFTTSSTITPTTSVVEGGTIQSVDYSGVSSLNREAVVLEQSMPDMYFFIPCRHGYKELMASFHHNRAYFMGVKDIAFVRHNYTVETDTPIYIESGGDGFNTERSDWTLDDDSNWYTY